MTDYTITRVSSAVRDVPLDHGDFKSYRFFCEDHGETVFSLLQKPDSAPPKPGDTFEATVKSTFDDGTVNLKKVQPQNSYKGGNGSRGHSPEERASIERQVAAKCATDLLVAWMARAQESGTLADIATNHRALADNIAEGIKG